MMERVNKETPILSLKSHLKHSDSVPFSVDTHSDSGYNVCGIKEKKDVET